LEGIASIKHQGALFLPDLLNQGGAAGNAAYFLPLPAFKG
jgi:hypothetical protein